MTELPKTYVDFLGHPVLHDGKSPVSWRVSAYVVVVREHAILMVEPVWASRLELPGGGIEIELQETLVEGAGRECREETGYRFTPDADGPRFIAESFFFLHAPARYCHSLMFAIGGTVDDQPDPAWCKDPDEINAVHWVPLASLAAGDVHLPHWGALRDLQII